MKLIIDINDEQVLFDIKNRGLESETETDKVIINALYDGIPLDDVKEEIDKAYEDITMYSCDEELSRFASKVCEILVRIGKTERVEI